MESELATEIGQTRGFSSLEEEAYLALVRTADVLLADIAELLKPHGLSPTQYNALRILRGAGEAGRTCAEVGERLLTRDPDITRLVDRLARRGLAERFRDLEDRRVVRNRITASGRDLLAQIDGPKAARTSEVMGVLGSAGLRAVIESMARLRAQLASLRIPTSTAR